MVAALITGLAAGYALAIPLGAVGLLIVDTSLRSGIRLGIAAGYGTSTVDVASAAVAAASETALAEAIQPVVPVLRCLSVVLLIVVAVRGTLAVRAGFAANSKPTGSAAGNTAAGRMPDAATRVQRPGRRIAGRVYLRFIGLTLVHPMIDLWERTRTLTGVARQS